MISLWALFGLRTTHLWHGIVLSLSKLIKMKWFKKTGLLIVLLSVSLFSFSQKIISEATLLYDIVIESTGKNEAVATSDGGTTTVYVKGAQSRSDKSSTLGKETIIQESKTGNGVILKEYSGQKLMITLNKDNWAEKNRSANDIKFEISNETAVIAGYTCKRAIANMGNGKTFVVYYSPDLLMFNKEYNATFKNLPGLVMQYEYESGATKSKYTLSKISFDPIPASKFDFPKSGYRVMTYEENQQMRKGS
jgi:GLPGLI family protein